MRDTPRKWLTAGILAVVLIGGIAAYIMTHKTAVIETVVPVPVRTGEPVHGVAGHSVQGRAIDSYTYGTGTTTLLFVGGIHGGYEWNSVLLAYTFMDYLDANPDAIPQNLSIAVIPSANPDAVYSITGKEGRFTSADTATTTAALARARFNADDVDINRNFDCKWQPKSTWQSKTVSAGPAAFSEPEAQAIRDYVTSVRPAETVFWHSASGAAYASQCKNGILPATMTLLNAYASAAGYPAVKTFDAYATTGAADDWMASIGLPAITVELKTHDTIEWSANLAGIKAMLALYGKK